MVSYLSAYVAAYDHTPSTVMNAMTSHGGMDIFGSDLVSVVKFLGHQGKLNMQAANCAGVAAVFQGLSLLLK